MILENTPELATERLVLRKFTRSDADAVLEIFSDEEVNTFLPWFPIKTRDEAKAFLQEKFLAYYSLPSAYRYALCLKDKDKPIGYVQVSDNESHDLGYGLKKEFWGKGIIAEASKAVVNTLKKAGYPYITATHDINNPRSGEIMKKIGMNYRYSYEEQCRPKDITVTFRMYQLNFGEQGGVYQAYWNQASVRFIEKIEEKPKREPDSAKHLSLLKLSENPEWIEKGAEWFHSRWGVPQEAYLESMTQSLRGLQKIPQWYLVLGAGGKIAAGIGIIANDFHERTDLSPNACALYVEPEYRGRGIALRLLDTVRREAGAFGFRNLYLVTNHTGFYEKYGWEFLTAARCGKESGRLYAASVL